MMCYEQNVIFSLIHSFLPFSYIGNTGLTLLFFFTDAYNDRRVDVQFFYVARFKTIRYQIAYGSYPTPLIFHYCLTLTIVFQLTLFLNSVVLNLFGHVLIVTTQLLKLLHYPLFSVFYI